jgi:hypothetical protein
VPLASPETRNPLLLVRHGAAMVAYAVSIGHYPTPLGPLPRKSAAPSPYPLHLHSISSTLHQLAMCSRLTSSSPFVNLAAAFLTQTVALNDTTVKFEIWDTVRAKPPHAPLLPILTFAPPPLRKVPYRTREMQVGIDR